MTRQKVHLPPEVEDDAVQQLLDLVDVSNPAMFDGDKVFTTSLMVAKAFGKMHKHVLRDIKRICTQLPEIFIKPNFRIAERDIGTGIGEIRKVPFYNLTRDAFALLTMGFTGKKAMDWKVKFLEAFSAMENELLKVGTAGTRQIQDETRQKAQKELPQPPRESEEARKRRCVKIVKALSAIWAHIDGLDLAATDVALCAHLDVGSLEDAGVGDHIKAFLYVNNVINNVLNTACPEEATNLDIEIVKRIAEGCAQWKFFRDQFVLSGEYILATKKTAEKMRYSMMTEFFLRAGYTFGANDYGL